MPQGINIVDRENQWLENIEFISDRSISEFEDVLV